MSTEPKKDDPEAKAAKLEEKLEHIRSLADVWDESKDKTRMQCAREIWAITEGE